MATATPLEALQQENEALRRRVEELERRLGEREYEHDELSRYERLVPYRELFEALPFAVSVYRSDGLELALNRKNREVVGVTREQIIGKHNLFKNPRAIERGYAESFRRAAAGEIVTMPHIRYDPTRSGLDADDPRWAYVQTVYLPFDGPDGARFIAEVHVDVTEQERARIDARERAELIRGLLEDSPIILFVKDLKGRYTMASRRASELTGRSAKEIQGKTDWDLMPQKVAEQYSETDKQMLETLEPVQYDSHMPTATGIRHLFTIKFPLLDSEGKPSGICGISSDVTEHRRAEEENRRLQDEVMRMREAALRALSTPLIPIAKGVLVMPLIGDVDQERSRQVLETLLHGVSHSRARIAILDVTGVTSAGPEVADGLIQAAKAVRLLGAQVVLTGIQPTMAQTLATMSDGLGDIVTRGTLESGVAFALRALRG